MKKTLLLITLPTLLFSSCQKKGTPEPVSGEVTFHFSHKESYTRAEPEVKEGEILAVLSTGAYNYSMASNYNRNLVPPIVMVEDGKHYLAVKPQTEEDLIRNDL
jgi:hypothetical protein